jgi:hypothetical protein
MNLYLCPGDFAMGDDMELSKIYPGNWVMMFLLLKKISISELSQFLLKIAMISYRLVFIVPSVM